MAESVPHDEARPESAKRKHPDEADSDGPRDSSADAPSAKRAKTEVDTVKQHYDSRPNQDVTTREKSPIIQVRHFNNWIKSVLIGQFVRPGDTVLDICGGKGGDLPKWQHGMIRHLVLADIAKESVKHAMDRYNESVHNRRAHFTCDFVAADCCSSELLPVLDALDRWFDLANCQFALHYSFESEERAHALIKNVSHRLKPGGWFIGVIPSAGWIMEKLRQAEGTSFGNDIYRISFEHRDLAPPRFGAKYKFYLEDAVDDVPEYLVHSETLVQIANQYGMDHVLSDTLWNFYLRHKDANADLLQRMRVHDRAGILQLSESGKELSGLYKVFVFRKRGTPEQWRNMDTRGVHDPSYRYFSPPPLDERDIFTPESIKPTQ